MNILKIFQYLTYHWQNWWHLWCWKSTHHNTDYVMNTDSLMFTFVVIPLFAPWCWDDPVSIALSRLAHRTVFVLAEMRHFHWIFRKKRMQKKRTNVLNNIIQWFVDALSYVVKKEEQKHSFLIFCGIFLIHHSFSFSKVVIHITNWNTILRWLAVISWQFNVLTHFTFINSWQFKPTCATVEDSFLSYLLISLRNINSISRLN